jgi:L-2-amino-thiazoline-4-carboxylic acid hydrolase
MAPAASRLMRWQAGWALRRELGQRTTAVVLRSADRRYVPPPPLARTSAGRFNLEMGAYLLALRDSLVTVGYEGAVANAILAQSLYRVMRRFYRPMDALAVAVHPRSRLARARWRQRLSRRIFFRPPDWIMDEIPQSRAYRFDVRRCVMAEFMFSRGEQRFCQDVVCKQDLLMAQGRGELLARNQVIAAGDDRCEFRFTSPRDRAGMA